MSKKIEEFNRKAGSKIVFFGKDIAGRKIEVMPTGLMNLDNVLGCGGFPKGRIVTISGLQSTSKTSLCLHLIGKLQKEGVKCCFVDAEYSLNLDHARAMGVDVDTLLIIEPETGEQAFEAIENVLREGLATFIVIDSASALSSKAEMEAETGKPTMGGQARLISQGLRKLVGLVSRKKAVLVFINQLRMNIMGGQYNPYIETGGMALKFYTSVALQLHKSKSIEKSGDTIGYVIRVVVKKNKVGAPGGETEITLMFETGFSEEADIIELALAKGLITRKGNTLIYGETKLGVGSKVALTFLQDHPELIEEIVKKLNP